MKTGLGYWAGYDVASKPQGEVIVVKEAPLEKTGGATSGGYGEPAPAPAASGGYGAPAPAPAASGGYGSPAPAPKPAPAASGGYGTPAPAAPSGGYGK